MHYFVDYDDRAFPVIREYRDDNTNDYTDSLSWSEAKSELLEHVQIQRDHWRGQVRLAREATRASVNEYELRK